MDCAEARNRLSLKKISREVLEEKYASGQADTVDIYAAYLQATLFECTDNQELIHGTMFKCLMRDPFSLPSQEPLDSS